MTLESLGWNDFFSAAFSEHRAASLVPARVCQQHKHAYELLSADGELSGTCTGSLLHRAGAPAELPAVGDWVAVQIRPHERHADIHAVLPRRTKFARGAAGDTVSQQIIAANIDTVFLVTALDHNYNLRRIERYLAAAWNSGARPVVLLNKADLHLDASAARIEVESIAPGVPVITLSAMRDGDLAPLEPWLIPGETVALLGSSGVGKSTLINRLIGTTRQATNAISDAVGKGRHTTTRRELIPLPGGALVIDTPGMRELQLWDTDATAVATVFTDIAALAAQCRFTDCTHRAEPGCAIQAALEAGTLDLERWQSFQKLEREQAYAARKADPRLAREHQAHWKKLHRDLKSVLKAKRPDE